MVNAKQVTNYDNLPIEGDYKVITLSASAFKLGYCGDTQSIGKVIELTINRKRVPFQIGETGIFEFNKYEFENNNSQEEAVIYVSEVRVPKDVPFTLDYFIE